MDAVSRKVSDGLTTWSLADHGDTSSFDLPKVAHFAPKLAPTGREEILRKANRDSIVDVEFCQFPGEQSRDAPQSPGQS